jgi:enamine deaminase RidA (YjgF/YER057c/UK114 family)
MTGGQTETGAGRAFWQGDTRGKRDSEPVRRAERTAEVSDVQRYGSGGPFEEFVGYSRVVRAGDFVFVSGCTSVADGEVVHAGEPAAQTRQAIENVRSALARVGGTLADVVRTRMFVTDIGRWEKYGLVHGEAFGEIRPAATMVEVSALIDPRMLVEIEADAYLGGRL